MDTTIFLAQLIGVYCLVIGSSMALKRTMLMGIFQELFGGRALSYVMGVLTLILGLLLVLTHTMWEGPPAVVITLIGWGVLAEALAFLFFSRETLARSLELLKRNNIYYGIALVYLVLGVYLVYSGFVA